MISLYCDGSAHGRPGLSGGWAYAIVLDGVCLGMQSGGLARTTSNQMELMAAREGLKAFLAQRTWADQAVELVSDSRLTLDIAAGTLPPTKDGDLCRAVRLLCMKAGARTRWVPGHTGVEWNEFVDVLAHEAMHALIPAKARRRAERKRLHPA